MGPPPLSRSDIFLLLDTPLLGGATFTVKDDIPAGTTSLAQLFMVTKVKPTDGGYEWSYKGRNPQGKLNPQVCFCGRCIS